ncbi:MAG: ribose-phosphate pyrophosphokinase [Ectothiorhodospiraceae bacterium]|nr:ribose-phosphate pyrophosphokinase [Ectothiorhodospiraceae bacterium]
MSALNSDPLIFVLDHEAAFGNGLQHALALDLAPLELRAFEDGEHKLRPQVSVRGRDVYLVHRLAGSPGLSTNDGLLRLLFFIATVRDLGAARITAVVPYLPYARKDRRTKPRDPVNLRYLAQLFEAMGLDRLVTVDAHNQAAVENAFRCELIHLEARHTLATAALALADDLPLVVLSPDTGGVKRAERLREGLQEFSGRDAGLAFLEKHRSEGMVRGDAVVGDLRDRFVLIVDDLIASGTTMRRAVDACQRAGAARVVACATHALFAEGSRQLIEHPGLHRLLVMNTVAVPESWPNVDVLPVEPQLARTVLALAGRTVDEPDPPLNG